MIELALVLCFGLEHEQLLRASLRELILTASQIDSNMQASRKPIGQNVVFDQ